MKYGYSYRYDDVYTQYRQISAEKNIDYWYYVYRYALILQSKTG